MAKRQGRFGFMDPVFGIDRTFALMSQSNRFLEFAPMKVVNVPAIAMMDPAYTPLVIASMNPADTPFDCVDESSEHTIRDRVDESSENTVSAIAWTTHAGTPE
uniref:Uncharacterized protein n=1 Tax=Eutreptiella gymnastica TaxID=73025 RepID=A0A7S4GJV6_9EUGL